MPRKKRAAGPPRAASRPGPRATTLAELRARLGWSGYEARKWLERGLPVLEHPRFHGDSHKVDEDAVMRWLAGRAEAAAPPPGPGEAADERDEWPPRDPISYGALLAHNATLFTLPALVAEKAVEAGVPMTVAQALADAIARGVSLNLREVFGHHADRFISADGVGLMYEENCAAEVDWRSLRERAGEPGWEPPRPTPGFGARLREDLGDEAEAPA